MDGGEDRKQNAKEHIEFGQESDISQTDQEAADVVVAVAEEDVVDDDLI